MPFNPVDKRTALTYIDNNGNWHRASKGAPEQVGFQFQLHFPLVSCISLSNTLVTDITILLYCIRFWTFVTLRKMSRERFTQ